MPSMKKFISNLKSHGSERTSSQPDHPTPAAPQPPSQAEIYRYAYHHGTNVGSLFLLESWLTPSLFPSGTGSELAAVKGHIATTSLEATRSLLEKHWRTFLSDDDLDWLVEIHCTAIRLPVGFWTLGSGLSQGTPFAPVAGVYENAWKAVRDVVSRCEERGLGVLIDLHGLPGGANGDAHSGTDFGRAELWGSQEYQDLAINCLRFIAEETKECPNIVGLQVCNEASWDAGNSGKLWKFYDRCVSAIVDIDATLPVYVSDAWDLSGTMKQVGQRNTVKHRGNPMVVDTHLYWCFSDEDKAKAPRRVIDDVPSRLSDVTSPKASVVDTGAVETIVGEYSCVMSEDTWSKAGGESKEDLVRSFGNCQSDCYQKNSSGSYFWTYKMEWMDGGEWGFKEMTRTGAVTAPPHLLLGQDEVKDRAERARSGRAAKRAQTVESHCAYWDQNHPGRYEHHRFEIGWDFGFDDALAFFEGRSSQKRTGANKIGLSSLWTLKRLRDADQQGPHAWEFEHGLRQGTRDLYELTGI